jgi:hypothetical protein
MFSSKPTRRAVFATVGAIILAAAPRIAFARHMRVAAPGIRVDVAPLRANAGDPTASWVAQFLPGQLQAELARRGASANVSVRIDYLTLGSSTGGIGPAGSSIDTIQGSATINGAEEPVRATNSYYPSPVDQTMIEQSNRIRVQQLTQALAYWIAQDAAR